MKADERSCYRRLTPYKYELISDFRIELPISELLPFESEHLTLSRSGQLVIRQTYAWDGPSGPSFDTPSFMRGSLVHDALYQLMRLSAMNYKRHRRYADRLLREMCLEDGMWRARAWYVYYAVRVFGRRSALPETIKSPEVRCAPN